jgi:thiol-disulfide isomerase/thioredoxin
MSVKVKKFGASWCGPCTVVSKQLEGLEVEHIDIDNDVDGLVKESNIRNVPTLIFYKDDVEVDRHIGLITRKAYLERVDKLNNQ